PTCGEPLAGRRHPRRRCEDRGFLFPRASRPRPQAGPHAPFGHASRDDDEPIRPGERAREGIGRRRGVPGQGGFETRLYDSPSPAQSEREMDALYSQTTLDRFADYGERFAPQYQSAEPFPHIVIDEFLPEELLLEGLNAFPRPRELPNREYDDN